jgi:hypothetical protein
MNILSLSPDGTAMINQPANQNTANPAQGGSGGGNASSSSGT